VGRARREAWIGELGREIEGKGLHAIDGAP
jgi:hypothetical protein